MVNTLKFREGDFLQIDDGAIFEVKGSLHPPKRVIALIRYMPDPKGDRKFHGRSYRKVYSIDERYKILKKIYPQFLIYDDVFNEYMPEVKHSSIIHSYIPVKELSGLRKKPQLDYIQEKTVVFTEILRREANITWKDIGITGSISVGLYTDASDIDVIVYGVENCLRVRNAMQNLLKSGQKISRYEIEGLKSLYQFRVKDTIMPFEEFVKHESRKSLQGMFDGKDVYIRCIKDWDEIEENYGEIMYKPEGYAKIRAKIIDDSESIFTPCIYKVKDVELIEGKMLNKLREIASFRGRFCEQAKNGETVIAQGKIERVIAPKEDHFRILLGSRPTDFMIATTSKSS